MTQVDGKALSAELRSQFPEVPVKVIEDIIHKNSNNRELCFEALNSECQRYQENLYGGVVSGDNVPLEGLQSNLIQGGDTGFQRSDSQASSGRHSAGSQGADHPEVGAFSLTPEPWLYVERPNIHHPPQVNYTPPQFPSVSSLSADPSRNSQPISTLPSNTAQHVTFSPPFVHSFNPRDQGFYSPYFPVPRFPGDSVYGAFGNRPRTFDPHYSPFHLRNLHPAFVGNPAMMRSMVNFTATGSRSPIPFSSYPQNPNYFQSLSTGHLHFIGNKVEEPTSIRHHLNQTPPGNSNIGTVGLPYHDQKDILAGPQQQSYLHGGLSQENLTADVLMFPGTPVFEMLPNNRPAQLSCPGSASSSRSGSLAGEDLAYTQTLVAYQRVRLDAFLADLGRQKEMLEQLRKEVGQLQQESLDRRLSKSDVFPTAADRQKMLTENQNLEMEIRLLNYEINLSFRGQSQLDWLDSEDQRFHDAISTGQFNATVQNHSTNTQPPHPVNPPQNSSPVSQPSVTESRVSRPRPARPPPPYAPIAPLPSIAPVPPDFDDGENWSCSACTFLNHPLLNKCECCEMPKLPSTPSALR